MLETDKQEPTVAVQKVDCPITLAMQDVVEAIDLLCAKRGIVREGGYYMRVEMHRYPFSDLQIVLIPK